MFRRIYKTVQQFDVQKLLLGIIAVDFSLARCMWFSFSLYSVFSDKFILLSVKYKFENIFYI